MVQLNTQAINAVDSEINAVTNLYNDIFELKKVRARVEACGVMDMTEEQAKETVFVGSISHMTVEKLRWLFTAMDQLDQTLLSPMGDTTPDISPLVAMLGVMR